MTSLFLTRVPFFLLPLFALTLCACPFVSNVPVSPPLQRADKMVFGEWAQLEADSSRGDEYTIEEHEDGVQKYLIYGPEGVYDGWISAVEQQWFLNLCDPAKPGTGYMLFRVDKMNYNTIELTPVSGRNKQVFTGQEHLKEWLKAHLGENSFYDAGARVRLVRTGA